MEGRWTWKKGFKLRFVMILMFLCYNLTLSWSLNSEGVALLRFKERVTNDPFGGLLSWKYIDGDLNPCLWSGVECSGGKVVILNLRDLCLGGTLAPELGHLGHIKAIVLRNNSFSGIIPKEIGRLEKLEMLDLGHNNFTGPFPMGFINNLALSILLLDNNKYLGSVAPKIHPLEILSDSQVDENQLTNAARNADFNSQPSLRKRMLFGDQVKRRLLQVTGLPNPTKAQRNKVGKRKPKSSSPSPSVFSPSPSPSAAMSPAGRPFSSISVPPSVSISSPSESPAPSPSEIVTPFPTPVSAPTPAPQAPLDPPVVPKAWQSFPNLVPFSAPTPDPKLKRTPTSKYHTIVIAAGVAGASLFIFFSALVYVYCRRSKKVMVKPWATGLSGQLQKAFVTGVPSLQRTELVTACEDFSNIIGSLPKSTVYKGTLSSGVEIAVTSTAVKIADDWSENLEAQFRSKIDTLSKVNHKNFVNLIGYSEEEEPFTRMLVFEYAPNGTLFEHLHVKESEHLDWGMRLRIAMGMAYCLDYLHQLNPPVAHQNMQSSSVYLTEDYAAKISDFSLWNEAMAAKRGPATVELLDIPSSDPESNVYSFGLILFEMITGRLPYSITNGTLADWVSDCLKEEKPQREMVDPTLKSYRDDELDKLFALVKSCVLPDSKQIPTMRDVVSKLKEITAMDPEAATPKSSPLWWAELEILSTDSS